MIEHPDAERLQDTATVGVDTQPLNVVVGADAAADDGLLDAIARIVDAFVWRPDGPSVAALAILGQQRIVDALRAADVVRVLADRHRPVRWAADSPTVVCSCGHGSYDHCPDGLILRGEA